MRQALATSPVAAANARRWLILSLVLTGQFVIVSSLATISVASAAIGDDLGASPASLQWTVSGYQLAYAASLITGGRLGDMIGRRRIFLTGLTVFVVASVACAAAPSIGVMIAARIVQGFAGGLASPQILAIIRVVFPPSERAVAFSWFGITAGSGFMVGQVITGGLIGANLFGTEWRGAFLFNAVLGAAALGGATALLPRRVRGAWHNLDFPGALLISSAVAVVLLATIQGSELGWPPALLSAPFLAICLLVAFIKHERRLVDRGDEPLIDFRLFRDRTYRVGTSILAAFSGMAFPTWFILTILLQTGFGFSPLKAALTMSLGPVFGIASSALAPRLLDRLGRRMFALAGLASIVAHVTTVSVFATAGASIETWQVMPLVALNGLANGAVSPAGFNVALASVPSERTGSASGVLQTAQQLVTAIGTAVYGIVFFGVVGDASDPRVFVHALACTETLAVICAIAIIALSTRLPAELRAPPDSEPSPTERL